MYIAHVFFTLWRCCFTAGTVFEKSSLGITDITDHPAPTGSTEVNFKYNSIQHIPIGYFVNLPNLEDISLYCNLISDIDPYAFAGTPSVINIYLFNNKLEVIREQWFSGLTNLQVLDLMENLLHTVEPRSFMDNTALTSLRLAHNPLQTLPECMFDRDNHPQNVNLRIYSNPLYCDQQIYWLKRAYGDWMTFYNSLSTVCAGPAALNGRTLITLTEQDLCITQGDTHKMFHKINSLFTLIASDPILNYHATF